MNFKPINLNGFTPIPPEWQAPLFVLALLAIIVVATLP